MGTQVRRRRGRHLAFGHESPSAHCPGPIDPSRPRFRCGASDTACRVAALVFFAPNHVSLVLARLWLLALPFIGAMGAWLSRRSGGDTRIPSGTPG